MTKLYPFLIILLFSACRNNNNTQRTFQPGRVQYAEMKASISSKKQQFAKTYFASPANKKQEVRKQITDFWIACVSERLYSYWKNTPWSFSGTTQSPQNGSIACGYFVTTTLVDMDLKINRVKLATCASSEMMKSLVPHQKIINLSNLTYSNFADSLKASAKGVYVIGLDFHTGFIIIDNKGQWFLHSNYINNKGVIKELVQNSQALKASKTRWMVSLTGDDHFIDGWLKGGSQL